MKYANILHYEMQGVNPRGLARLFESYFKWREKRMQSNVLVRLYRLAAKKCPDDRDRFLSYADRVELCATWLRFGILEGKKRLTNAMFCKLRLCPMCIARGAITRARLLSQVMDAVQMEKKCQYIFLTLTAQSVSGDKLGEELSALTSGWDRLCRQRPVQRAVKGWFRALEITRNSDPESEWYGMFHPHIHAIIAVEDEYFKKKSGLYIEHEEWVRRWKMALGVKYDPSVRISKTTGAKGGKGVALEAAKYTTKSYDYIDSELPEAEAVQVVIDYTKALYHRRLTAFGGWLKETAKRLQAGDLNDVDLVNTDGVRVRDDVFEAYEEYGWHYGAGDYVLARRTVNPLRVKQEVNEENEVNLVQEECKSEKVRGDEGNGDER